MREIEIKILEIDLPSTISKLEKLGAKKTFEGEMSAIYYDYEDRSLSGKGRLLRLRKKGEKSELTFKEKITQTDAKVMDELEVIVDDFDLTQAILKKLGLKEVKSAQKYRISYSIGAVHFELDTLPGIPTFLEIEAPSLDILKSYVLKLGYSMKDAKPWSGKDVLKYYDRST
ncbi:MAG: class IV adenylate cyclase [Nanoarchaeota archaeon]